MNRLKVDKFLNFAVGPVMMDEEILELGSNQLPYFRTQEFSNLMLENEMFIKKLVKADEDARAVFLTASGTGAMEAAIINTFNKNDKLLVVNGGSFGQRFVDICNIHGISFEDIKLKYGESLKAEHLEKYKNKGFTGFLVNIHETSSGVLYDIDLISKFCKNEDLILIVDAISSFLADDYNMGKYSIDITILSSQKALSLPPGISIIVISRRVKDIIGNNANNKTLYFDLNRYLIDGERGQTPFTPAVGTLIQLNRRLDNIINNGIEYYLNKTKCISEDFRKRIVELPFVIPHNNLSNAVTPIQPIGKMNADEIFKYLKDKYNIFLCPNGGELKEKIIRVGHIGELKIEHNDILIEAFKEMYKEGIL